VPRGAVQAAQTEIGRQHSVADQNRRQSQNLYNTLVPQLTAESTNPQGYAPEDLAALNTASSQSVGGSQAGTVGQGNLTAARTRNAGGFGAAMDESARAGGRQLSENALQVQGANADLKEQQRQTARSALQGLYGNNLQATLTAMGMTPGTIGQWTNAAQATSNSVLGGINAAANLLHAGRPKGF
jgi:hypothetical protein